MANHHTPESGHHTLERFAEIHDLTEDEVKEVCDSAGIRFVNFNGGLVCKGLFEPALEAWRAARPQPVTVG